MVISHRYRYLFVENPLTASWAIRNELLKYYDGEPIRHKHATIQEFLGSATRGEKNYFSFATVRNPLDVLVSRYFKLKTNHKGAFTDPQAVESLLVDYSDRRKYEDLHQLGMSFEEAFRRYWKFPYSDQIELSSNHLDFVIRFERLQQDFSEIMRRLGLRQVRSIPVVNKTREKKEQWESYYTSATIPIAKKACGPFMREWGYEFPEAWGPYRNARLSSIEYFLFSKFRGLYQRRVRFSPTVGAKLIRKLRAYLIA